MTQELEGLISKDGRKWVSLKRGVAGGGVVGEGKDDVTSYPLAQASYEMQN